MKNDKGKNVIISLLVVVIIILCIVVTLALTGMMDLKINKDSSILNENTEEVSDTEDSITNGIKNNLTIVLPNECSEGCTKIVSNKDNNQSKLYVSSSEIKLGETSILKYDEGPYDLKQVSVYNDIIIILQTISLSSNMIIYDFEGNEIKTISLFNDKQGRLLNVYPGYSNTESFNVSDDGVISFVGTKHLQGVANTYIIDNGNTIDLCTQGEYIDDSEIVSGIFKMAYLENYSFSDITYVSTKTIVKDIKSCN